VKTSRHHTLFIDEEKAWSEIATLCCGRALNVEFKVISYEEARKAEPLVGSRMLLAQTAALGAHRLIPENGPGLTQEKGPHAGEGGEVPQGVFAPG
jgi:hypothetical protein